MKESLEGMELTRPLDLTVDGKLHVLFGGTKLVQHTPPQKTQAHLKGNIFSPVKCHSVYSLSH